MATRRFSDGDGVEWTVWMTQPSPGAVLRTDFAQGWLTFESATGVRRRLAPVPTTWESCSCDDLGALCQQATQVHPRLTPIKPQHAIEQPPDQPPTERA